MEYTAQRSRELIISNPWLDGENIRIFWIGLKSGSREDFALGLKGNISNQEIIIPLVIRQHAFFDVNSIMSDTMRLFDNNRSAIEEQWSEAAQVGGKITFAIIGREDFRLPQTSSRIPLPSWFPLQAGCEVFFTIADLGSETSIAMLNCQEARIENIAEWIYEIENAMIERLKIIPQDSLRSFVRAAHRNSTADGERELKEYSNHLANIAIPRGYRPNAAQDGKSIVTRLLRLVLSSSPKELAEHAKAIAEPFGGTAGTRLNPTYFSIMLRPTEKLTIGQANWHSILLGLYQGYQIMNGAAHAGDYCMYPIDLQFAGSADLRRFLSSVPRYFSSL